LNVSQPTVLGYVFMFLRHACTLLAEQSTRVGTLIVATIYLQLIQNRYMFRSLKDSKTSKHVSILYQL